MRGRTLRRTTGLLAALAATAAARATVLHVNGSATAEGNGSTWPEAMSDLQAAIAVAAAPGSPVTEIWVAGGSYAPGDPATSFELVNGVGIYGGFAGGETLRDQRDPQSNPTTLTGAVHVVRGDGVDASAVLDGFWIIDGTGDDGSGGGIGGVGGAGGGMLLLGASPTINNCRLRDNTARLGAGVYVADGSPTFTGCDISSNTSARSGEGAGIYATVTPGAAQQHLALIDCTVSANFAEQGHFATGHGAGVYCGAGVDLTVLRCTMNSNFTAHNQSYGDATTGGAISFRGGEATIAHSTFMENISAYGAAVYSTGALACTNCVFIGNRAVAVGCAGPECNGAPDVPSGYGGGVYAPQATIVSSTFHANWAAKEGAGAVTDGLVANSILWGNRTPPVCCGEDPLPPPRVQIGGAADLRFSCVEALFTPAPGEDPILPEDVPGCFDADPMFVDDYVVSEQFGWLLESGDAHLGPGSPCIDAADNGAVPAGVAEDIDGEPRFADDPLVTDTGLGAPPLADIGADEHHVGAPTCAADLTGPGGGPDGNVDALDFLLLIGQWGSPCPGPCDADVTGPAGGPDGNVDALDFLLLIGQWGSPAEC